jgi:hypothetical protein
VRNRAHTRTRARSPEGIFPEGGMKSQTSKIKEKSNGKMSRL